MHTASTIIADRISLHPEDLKSPASDTASAGLSTANVKIVYQHLHIIDI